MDRRDFLQGAALSTAALIVSEQTASAAPFISDAEHTCALYRELRRRVDDRLGERFRPLFEEDELLVFLHVAVGWIAAWEVGGETFRDVFDVCRLGDPWVDAVAWNTVITACSVLEIHWAWLGCGTHEGHEELKALQARGSAQEDALYDELSELG